MQGVHFLFDMQINRMYKGGMKGRQWEPPRR